jgi:VWFA-related protein
MRQRIVFTLLAVLTASLTAGPAVATEEQPKGQFGELVEVSEVLLDVLVTDKKGNVIVGLDADDFVVTDAGAAVPLTGASFYSNRFEIRDDDASRINKPAANEVPADRYFIFFFHDQLRPGGEASPLVRQQFEAARKTERWVREEMLPGDWVAVVSYDVKLKVHQDFTRDRQALLRALEDATISKDPANVWGSRRPEVPEGQPTLLSNLPEGKDLRDETTRIYDGMRLVAEATRDVVGRKSLVLFSTGFGRLDTSIPNVALPDTRFYPELEQALNDNNVAVYSVDLTPVGFTSNQQNFLTELSTDTGGEYFGTFNNFIVPLRQIADEANGYYLLSYQSEHAAGETGYRKVKVETRNPDFKVRARQGYRFGS